MLVKEDRRQGEGGAYVSEKEELRQREGGAYVMEKEELRHGGGAYVSVKEELRDRQEVSRGKVWIGKRGSIREIKIVHVK